MSRRLGVLATALLLPLLGGCFLDPTCEPTCDGDVIARCGWECSGEGKLDVDECHREYSQEDCAAQTGPSGGPKTCRLVPTQGSAPVPTCVDANMPRCDPEATLFCTGPHSWAACLATTEGGYISSTQEDICADTPGLECHTSGASLLCVDSPKQRCDPATYPRCLDGGTLLECLGTPAAEGSYVRTLPCQPARCTGAPGAARCQS
ncbi:hypothetical protein [Archangium sp.]|jgi:hypothetical protein|uniref:hypothetical protein n=1 Tax=Archangium sp. TaxID=1872627 RepID=UPI002EDB79DA